MMRPPLTITYAIIPAEMDRLVHQERDGRVRQRLLALKLVLEGDTIPAVAARLGVSETPLRTWTHRFNREGPKGLLDRPRSGQPPKLAVELMEDFKERVCSGAQPADGVCSLRGPDLQRILKEEYGADYSLGGTYFLLHRLGFSSLMPRPRHPEADEAAQEDFKKTFCRRR